MKVMYLVAHFFFLLTVQTYCSSFWYNFCVYVQLWLVFLLPFCLRYVYTYYMIQLEWPIRPTHVVQDMHKIIVRFQKLLKNLFHTLHGQNVHCQKRELSTFLLHYHQFISQSYCGASWPVSKMASQQEKAFSMLHVEVSRSVIQSSVSFVHGLKIYIILVCYVL
jgi:hypothetical protein